MSQSQKVTVVYDNTCRTCTVARSFGEKLDTASNIEFVGMHTDKGRELATRHGLDMEKSAYAISEDGSVASHSEMVRTVLRATGFFGRLLGYLLRILPASIADRLYDFVSKHRIR